MASSRFFLGANSPGGFYSLYDDFTDTKKDALYILKGGPGCGKSTFMKAVGKAAEEAGYFVQYIPCSGDPDSLDGVYVPDRGMAWVDGTSPHVIEPKLAGAQARYVNLGAFYDAGALEKDREEIGRLTAAYKAQYARAFRLLAGVAALSSDPVLPGDAVLTAARRAQSLIRRELRGTGSGGTVRRFLSAYTCKGYMCLWDTVEALCARVYVLDNDLCLGTLAVEAAAQAAEERGFASVRCQSPLFPKLTEHLLIPELDLAIVTQTSRSPYPGKPYRHLRLDAAPGREALPAIKAEHRRLNKLREPILREVTLALSRAKALHDELESHYIPNTDFTGVTRLTRRHIETLLDTE